MQDFKRLRDASTELAVKRWPLTDAFLWLQRDFERGRILTHSLTAEREYLEKHGSLPPPSLPSNRLVE